MHRDFVEMLSELKGAGAEFLVVGAHALAAHGPPRYTGDLDIWLRPVPENARRVFAALKAFGSPSFDFTVEDLTRPGTVFQIGVPPVRIDFLTSISGVDFDAAWSRRSPIQMDGVDVFTISRDDFVANKRAAGRPKDLADIALLEEFEEARRKAGT